MERGVSVIQPTVMLCFTVKCAVFSCRHFHFCQMSSCLSVTVDFFCAATWKLGTLPVIVEANPGTLIVLATSGRSAAFALSSSGTDLPAVSEEVLSQRVCLVPAHRDS